MPIIIYPKEIFFLTVHYFNQSILKSLYLLLRDISSLIKKTGSVDLHAFVKWNEYCSYDLLMDIGIDEIKEKANLRKLRYSEKDLIKNFNDIFEKVGCPPLYTEFRQYTKIPLNTYASKYKLKGKVYQQLMKMMLTDNQFEQYIVRYKNNKSSVGKITGLLSAQYTDKDYENEFKRIFDGCIKEFDSAPSRRLFDKISNFESSMYRRKYNKSWLEICEMYGYQVEKNHKSEKILLNIIKGLTGINYSPQKTWKWLIGVGGKNMFCDGYFQELKLVVEFDGQQHRVPVKAFGGEERFLILKQNDKLKEKLLNENNIKLFFILPIFKG